MPATLGYGTGLAIISFVVDYTQTSFSGQKGDPTVDEVDRKTFLRKNRRRPIEETIAELGEGRGEIAFPLNAIYFSNISRYLWTRIRGEEKAENQGELRHRGHCTRTIKGMGGGVCKPIWHDG
jgi:hypothetical protein